MRFFAKTNKFFRVNKLTIWDSINFNFVITKFSLFVFFILKSSINDLHLFY